MGIKGLSNFLKKQCNQVFVTVPDIARYSGKRFAIDVSIFMYKFAYGRASNTFDFLNQFIQQHKSLKLCNIEAIYIFDGEHIGKENTHEERAVAKGKAEASRDTKIEVLQKSLDEHVNDPVASLSISSEIYRLQHSVITITKQHYVVLQQLFQEHNIPYHIAAGEAEKGCADLCVNGGADVVVTEDYDALVCGAPVVLKNLGSSNKPMIEIQLNNVLGALQLTYAQFVDFCILCGSDFNPSLPKIGPVTAYKHIKRHFCIENILLATGYNTNEEVLKTFKYQLARSNFIS